jgi:poly(A) polymerase
MERDRLVSMADGWWRLSPAMPPQSARAWLYRLGPDRYRERVLFAWTRSGAPPDHPGWHTLIQLPQHWQAPKFPLRAADFIARGVPKGPALGAALAAAETAWMAADFPLDPAILAALAETAAATGT